MSAAAKTHIDWSRVDSLIVRPPFSDLFPIDSGVLDRITQSMREEGFHESKPIEVWGPEGVVVDGHTRLRAAKAAGLHRVPIAYLSFDGEAKALEWAMANQRDRRNLTNEAIYRRYKAVDARKSENGRPAKTGSMDPVSSGPSREATAKAIGRSTKDVQRLRLIDRYTKESGDPSIRDAMRAGTLSIRMAADRDSLAETLADAYARLRQLDPNWNKPGIDSALAAKILRLAPKGRTDSA